MTPDRQKAVFENARNAARAYARGRAWLDVEDLTQEAICAQLSAARRYNPGFGVPFEGFTWRVAVLALLRYTLYAASPVTCKSGGYVPHWKEICAAARGPALDDLAHLPDAADVEADVLAERVRSRIVEVLGPAEAEFAFGLLAGGWRPREVAADHGWPVRRVGKDLRKTKDKLRADRELRAIWSES